MKISLEVLAEKLSNIHEMLKELKEENKAEHEEVRNHVARTNGKVAQIEKWRYYFTGVGATIAILWTVLTFIIPLVEKW